MKTYVEAYKAIPFEPIQIEFRRKLVLQEINKFSPKTLLEVGCGEKPLFLDLPLDLKVTVVEPAIEFATNALELSAKFLNAKVINNFIENTTFDIPKFDMIILSCVLHELADPKSMLLAIKKLCHANTLVHINVPNAYSLHRQLACSMGIISSINATSDMQKNMQQNSSVYSMATLTKELSDVGFRLKDSGSIFVKPFTHAQMQCLVDSGFMTDEMLNGLANLANIIPGLGSEIWINAVST